jgi:hypothetical protein
VRVLFRGCGSRVQYITIVYRYKLVRGALDFGGVVNRATARSRYGGTFLCSLASGIMIDTSNSQEAKIIDHTYTFVCSPDIHPAGAHFRF